MLDSVRAKIRGASTWTNFVDNIDYNERRQRLKIEHANDTDTVYSFDELTYRLTRIKTTRTTDSKVIQNLGYTFDPVGNIVEVTDSALQTVYFDNAVVSGTQKYEYDAIYRLVKAEGREHKGIVADAQRDQTEIGLNALPHANQSNAVRNYIEEYEFDVVGNIEKLIHTAVGDSTASWTRHYDYGPLTGGLPTTNRLRSTSLPGDTPGTTPYSATYSHDAHGNVTSMPHLSSMDYHFNDQLWKADKGGGGIVYFCYDAGGQRVRKVWEHSGIIEERIYVSGGYEIYRKTISGSVDLERETLHIHDDTGRICMVETKTIDSGSAVGSPVSRERYQLTNHLGTSATELDASGNVFSYEEFHPFGTISYRSGDATYDVSAKRYRYTGKERDDETGLDYHGLRYRAGWLARWMSADPLGAVDGTNLFRYARNSPIVMHDPSGGHGRWGQLQCDLRGNCFGSREQGMVPTCLPEIAVATKATSPLT